VQILGEDFSSEGQSPSFEVEKLKRTTNFIQLRNKMNSIFKNDCELIKTISNKKAYPNCRPEVIDIVKKSTVQPLATKENIVLAVAKTDKVDNVLSPRAFVEINRLV
jgi:hypothetical protein